MPQKWVEILLININNVNIECVANFDFFGVTIDKKLTWNGHIGKYLSSYLDELVS